MLERMALFEQQVFDLKTTLSNTSSTHIASQPHYGLSAWEQKFRKNFNAVAHVHAEQYAISKHANSTTCVNPECDFIIPLSAKFCACGMPTD